MKVLMINVVCGIRSTGRICTDLATELERQGHEVKIAYGRFDVPEQFKKYAVRIGSDIEVKINAIKARIFDNEGLNGIRATKKFIIWAKQYNPDVIHIHNIHGYYLNYKVLFTYLRTCGKKIIWTLHDCWAFTGHTAYCDAVGCEKWKTGCGKCSQIKEYPKALIDQSGRNWEEKRHSFTKIPNLTIVTPSEWLASHVKGSFLNEYPVEVIHNGIDTKNFMPLENDFKKFYGIEDKKMLLGVASSWDENKGYSDYLKLANLLGSDYQVVLVGVTDEQQKHLPENVLGIRKTSSVKELAQIYSAADCLLNLSKTENYPTVNLEAMCCNTPVITYDVGGSKESVEVGGGIVVKKGDLMTIVETVRKKLPECYFDKSSFDNVKFVEEYMRIAQKKGGF